MSVPEVQLVPLKPKTRPSESTARQNTAVGHETPVRPEALVPASGGSLATDAGGENPWPFQVSAPPLLSTSTQNEVVAHETEFSWPAASASLGWVQVWPSQTEGPPSAATQKAG